MIGCRRVPSPCRSGWTRVPGEERVSGSFRDADRPGVAGTAEPQSVGGQDLQVFVIQPVRTAEPLDLAPRAGHHRGKRPAPGRSRRCEVDRAARRRCGARRHLPRCRHRRVPSRLPVRRNGHIAAHPPHGSRARPTTLLPVTAISAVRGDGKAGSPISDWRRRQRAVMEGIITAEAQVAEGNRGHFTRPWRVSSGCPADAPVHIRPRPPSARYTPIANSRQVGTRKPPPASSGTERPYLDRLRQDPISVGIRTERRFALTLRVAVGNCLANRVLGRPLVSAWWRGPLGGVAASGADYKAAPAIYASTNTRGEWHRSVATAGGWPDGIPGPAGPLEG